MQLVTTNTTPPSPPVFDVPLVARPMFESFNVAFGNGAIESFPTTKQSVASNFMLVADADRDGFVTRDEASHVHVRDHFTSEHYHANSGPVGDTNQFMRNFLVADVTYDAHRAVTLIDHDLDNRVSAEEILAFVTANTRASIGILDSGDFAALDKLVGATTTSAVGIEENAVALPSW